MLHHKLSVLGGSRAELHNLEEAGHSIVSGAQVLIALCVWSIDALAERCQDALDVGSQEGRGKLRNKAQAIERRVAQQGVLVLSAAQQVGKHCREDGVAGWGGELNEIVCHAQCSCAQASLVWGVKLDVGKDGGGKANRGWRASRRCWISSWEQVRQDCLLVLLDHVPLQWGNRSVYKREVVRV